MALFQDYPWLGNVRELENCIERAVILAQGPEAEGVWPNKLTISKGIKLGNLPGDFMGLKAGSPLEARPT